MNYNPEEMEKMKEHIRSFEDPIKFKLFVLKLQAVSKQVILQARKQALISKKTNKSRLGVQ